MPPASLFPKVDAAGTPLSDTDARDGWSAQALLLPFIEAVNLASTINFDIGYKQHPPVTMAGEIRQISSFRVDLLLCPSELNDRRRGEGTAEKHYPLSYAVNAGVWLVFDPDNGKGGAGAFTTNRPTRLNEFIDGTSHTLMFAEVKAYDSQRRRSRMSANRWRFYLTER